MNVDISNQERNTRLSSPQLDNTSTYYIKDSGIGNSWSLGDDTTNSANAFPDRVSGCTYNLSIPATLTDVNGTTKIIEVIGQFAFYACANKLRNGATRIITLPKQVKVIEYGGLGGMDDLEVFNIEQGSKLETIEGLGLDVLGKNTVNNNPNKRTGVLVLPSTVSSVHERGINLCTLFHTIIYCGSHFLFNSSTLEDVSTKTVVKVTSRYPKDQHIFGRTPDRSQAAVTEAEEECQKTNKLPNICDSHQTGKALTPVLISSAFLSSGEEKKWAINVKSQFDGGVWIGMEANKEKEDTLSALTPVRWKSTKGQCKK